MKTKNLRNPIFKLLKLNSEKNWDLLNTYLLKYIYPGKIGLGYIFSDKISPKLLNSFEAIFRKILLIILPDLVFGRPGENCNLSGVAMGPIFFLIH